MKKMKTNFTKNIFPDLFEMLRRFPVAVLVTVILCVYLLVGGGSLFSSNYIPFLAGSAAFLAAGAGHLFAEGRGHSGLSGFGGAVLLSGFAAAVMYFNKSFQSSGLYFFTALQLILMLSPFLRRGVEQGAVWLFNLRLLLAALLALIVGLVFGGGMSAVLVGLDFLLGVKIDNRVYEDVWIVAVTLIGPIYGLSLVPENLNEEINMVAHKGNLLERGVSVLVNYVMVPLAGIYAFILHAYAAKIAFIGNLPKGEIGWIVSLFAIGGTATWLIGWPWRDTGTKLLRLFMRAWFWLLPIPVALLVMAVWRRVSDYGVTPDRYGIAIVAVWAVLVFAYLVWRRNRADMRMILSAAAILLLIGSFGPQGAYGLTGASQYERLQVLLTQVGVLKDGKVLAKLPALETADATAGYSMVRAIVESKSADRLRPLFDDTAFFVENTDANFWILTDNLSKKLGFANYGQSPDYLNFNAQLPIDKNWSGKTRFIGPVFVNAAGTSSEVAQSNFAAVVKDGKLNISLDGRHSQIEVVTLMAKLKAAMTADPNKQPIFQVDVDPHLALLISTAYGKIGEKSELNSLQFWAVQHE